MTIIEFLEARIAEDETLASEAARGSNGKWRRGREGWAPDDDECRVEGDAIAIYDEGGHDADQAEHIATHDPARVLAECAAKRAIIKRHEYECMGADDAAGKGCALDYEAWPCSTVRHLAVIYSDHPDYQQEWAKNG
ncbi:DUF6221 family protein [Paenarthrobacter nitroguajacolicus]|uniref:DUF6221 family protein n=1 Tax=Paenarthrobacter nitroguajacolicus TaxID=211146 RepID=UPI003AE8A738